ncbi:PREDICTED: large subunit GTPase 1 homolog [Priapulus caudatus]|uniref:Large subunit GTPase 1 homolog n=1 Tax=Priapulus caudatus TaxID=37621 RepID=A0ABM1F2T5_PRICU|nr:PREDICTED: large subunit GTPase 1 homolog [Priapulus caudatus]
MGKKNHSSGLGNTIIKNKYSGKARGTAETFLHTSQLDDGYDWNRLNLTSVTEQNTLDEFLSTAELAGREFTAEKRNIKVVDSQTGGLPSTDELLLMQDVQDKHRELLKIPRRPEWDVTTSAEELQQREQKSFLEWRRGLSQLQEMEHICMTPYEKNLEFWRQLWRVIERSDVVIQIVDARDPLLFRCEDLEKYVKEVNPNKLNAILVNKADMLTAAQRQIWLEYFDANNIRAIFFSAMAELEDIKKMEKDMRDGSDSGADADDSSSDESRNADEDEDEDEDEDAEDEDEDDVDVRVGDLRLNAAAESSTAAASVASATHARTPTQVEDVDRECGAVASESCGNGEDTRREATREEEAWRRKLLSRSELLDAFRTMYEGETHVPGVTTIGLVGYPNVGKSSTINALFEEKKVAVSATPGKTKHFQTLLVDETLMLCDCPGLVMPTFIATKADMVLSGILPIDQMRDHVAPTTLLCQRLPRQVFEDIYSIIIKKPQEGEPQDRPATAEELLNSYSYMRGYMTNAGRPDEPRGARILLKDYVKNTSTVHVMGKKAKPVSKHEAAASAAASTEDAKPWKRHNNRNRREKLRRVYSERDADL